MVSFGIVKWNNLWHVVALESQGEKVLKRKVLTEGDGESPLASEAQAYDRLRMEADLHFMAGEDAFK